jgi:hypothetical protein
MRKRPLSLTDDELFINHHTKDIYPFFMTKSPNGHISAYWRGRVGKHRNQRSDAQREVGFFLGSKEMLKIDRIFCPRHEYLVLAEDNSQCIEEFRIDSTNNGIEIRFAKKERNVLRDQANYGTVSTTIDEVGDDVYTLHTEDVCTEEPLKVQFVFRHELAYNINDMSLRVLIRSVCGCELLTVETASSRIRGLEDFYEQEKYFLSNFAKIFLKEVV